VPPLHRPVPLLPCRTRLSLLRSQSYAISCTYPSAAQGRNLSVSLPASTILLLFPARKLLATATSSLFERQIEFLRMCHCFMYFTSPSEFCFRSSVDSLPCFCALPFGKLTNTTYNNKSPHFTPSLNKHFPFQQRIRPLSNASTIFRRRLWIVASGTGIRLAIGQFCSHPCGDCRESASTTRWLRYMIDVECRQAVNVADICRNLF